MRWVSRILEVTYGSPDHANKADPLDELVYIQLSRRTHEIGYTQAYANLSKLGSWDRILEAGPDAIFRAIRVAGLGPKRAREIYECLRIIQTRYGRVSLDPIKKLSNDKLFDFLTGLPGVGAKTAYCVMMYSLHRAVFPADAHVITVCERLGLIPAGLNHKVAQRMLAELFPEGMRHALHVNLLAHGRRVCLKRNPRCGDCDLRKFCWFYRNKTPGSGNKPRLTFADLFCGGGGATLGFMRAGFAPRLLLDSYQPAADTAYLNLPTIPPGTFVVSDIRDLSAPKLRGFGRPKVLIAGLPCQGWSKIGKNSINGGTKSFELDPRNLLYREVLRCIRTLRPQFALIENVPPLAQLSMGKYEKRIVRALRRARYLAKGLLLNALDFGVPQHRMRYFLLATRIGAAGSEGARTILDDWARAIQERKVSDDVRRGLVAGPILRNLPSLRESIGGSVLVPEGVTSGTNVVYNHEARTHNERDRELFDLLKPGETAWHAIEKYGRPDLMRYSLGNFKTKYRRLKEDAPFPTVIAHLEKDSNSYIHPTEPRGLTVREAARAQTFPDDYVFLGGRMRAFRLVGNAVPPMLAENVAGALLGVIEGSKNVKSG